MQSIGASGLHRMAYLEWGEEENPRVLVCVHGLTRCARDFDFLARALCAHYRVVCPDVPGRGDSDWLRDPKEYALPTYLSGMVALLARLDVERVHWLGTSMGGLIGMALASLEQTPVARLVLNDVGPVLTAASLDRIGGYLGSAPAFSGIDEAERYVRAVAAPFGPHSDAEWRFLTEHVVRQGADGAWRMKYDPAIAQAFAAREPEKDIELWGQWDAVSCPTLVLRGEHSDLLARETVEEMARRGPRAKVVEIAGIGHAPTLIHADQIALVKEFFLAG